MCVCPSSGVIRISQGRCLTLGFVVSTVGPLDNLDIDEEAGTATPTIAGSAFVLVPLGTEGRSGAGGIGLNGGIAEALIDVGVLTAIGLPFKKTMPKFRQYCAEISGKANERTEIKFNAVFKHLQL